MLKTISRRNKNRELHNRISIGSLLVIFVILAMLAAALYILISGQAASDEQETAVSDETCPPLVMVWEYAAIKANPESIGPMSPVGIVSPTWLRIVDEAGTIENNIDHAYLEWAKGRNYDIWVLVTNSFDPQITAAILSDEQIRINIADKLIDLSLEYDLDGINVDFENFHVEYRDFFTLFISELGGRCRQEGLVLSVDVTMISTSEYWSMGYDRAALAAEADYIIVMAYDEHWSTSPVAGSVASLPWVEQGLQLILSQVPPEQLILGVPFYTRLWELENVGETRQVLKSWSYSMHRAQEIIVENDAVIEWDENARQHTASFTRDGLDYIMWLEDTTSMSYRLDLVNQYELAGVACWRRGLEKDEIWTLINDWLDSQ